MENITHMLVEISDEMQKSIETVDRVVAEQNELIQIVVSSDKAEKFESFTNSLQEQIDNGIKQKEQLQKRSLLLSEVIDACQDEKIANAISTFAYAFGIFGLEIPEPKITVQEPELKVL